MLCSFLPYKKMNQPYMTYMPCFLDFLPIQFTTVQLSSVCSHQLSVLYRVLIVYMCQPQSPSSSHTTFPFVSIHLFSAPVSFFFALQIGSSIPFFQMFIATHTPQYSELRNSQHFLNTVLQYHLSYCIVIIIIYVPLDTKVCAHVSSHLWET